MVVTLTIPCTYMAVVFIVSWSPTEVTRKVLLNILEIKKDRSEWSIDFGTCPHRFVKSITST